LDASESQNIGGSVENTEHLEKLNVSGSPLVGRLDETVETAENMLIQESAGILESPQKFVSECPTSARLVETMELSDMSESYTVGRSVETVETLEKSNVSGSPSASRFAGTLERPGKLDIAESPTAGCSLEQMAIAPETPIQCTTSVRSFESPERPDIYDADGLRSKTVEKEICRSLDQELDFNLLNEVKQ
jgi:cohesin complex subunit SCC1